MCGVRCHVRGHAGGYRWCVRKGAGTQVEFLTDLPHRNRAGHHEVREHPRRLQDAGGGGLPGRDDLPRAGGGGGH